METKLKKSFSWEIENLFSDKNDDVLESEPFSSGGCQWLLSVLPKGFGGGGHLTTRVEVYDPCTSLRSGWKRRVKFGKELARFGDRYFGNDPCTSEERQKLNSCYLRNSLKANLQFSIHNGCSKESKNE